MENFLSTVLTSSLVVTVAGIAINAWLENRKSKHVTRYDALVAAVTLEGYAITCAEKLSDHKTAVSSKGHAGAFLASVPELPQLSVVAGFIRYQKASVANRLMVFPQEVREADQAVAFWWDVVGDIDIVRHAATKHVARIGMQSLVLARDIRAVFDLPTRSLEFGEYDVWKVLEGERRENSGD